MKQTRLCHLSQEGKSGHHALGSFHEVLLSPPGAGTQPRVGFPRLPGVKLSLFRGVFANEVEKNVFPQP